MQEKLEKEVVHLKLADLGIQGEGIEQHRTNKSDVSGLTENEKETLINQLPTLREKNC